MILGSRSTNLIDQSHTHAPSVKELRKFALTVGLAIAFVFGFLLPWLFGKGWLLWPFVLGAILIVWGIVHPASLGPVYSAWMKLGLLLNKIVSPVVLGSIFFLIFFPVAVVIKLLKKNLIDTEFDDSASTYRTVSSIESANNYERPF